MRSMLSSSLLGVASLALLASTARAERRDDLCAAPKEMKTAKWQPRSEVGGMSILIPPGFGVAGNGNGLETAGAHYYANGEHRTLVVGFGPGIQSIMRDPAVMQKGECDLQINGRRAEITVYNWVVEDARYSASGDAGAHFAAVARFYPSGGHPEVFVAVVSNSMPELKMFKPIFWTVSFDGAPAVAGAPAVGAATSAGAATPVANVAAVAPASAVVTGQVCSTAPPPTNLPAASAVVDSATIGALLAGASPIPSGFEVMRLQFDGSGELAGLNVSQSDLPEASQKELATIVGTNIKVHDSKSPPSIYLRIDSSATGLRYSVVAPPAC